MRIPRTSTVCGFRVVDQPCDLSVVPPSLLMFNGEQFNYIRVCCAIVGFTSIRFPEDVKPSTTSSSIFSSSSISTDQQSNNLVNLSSQRMTTINVPYRICIRDSTQLREEVFALHRRLFATYVQNGCVPFICDGENCITYFTRDSLGGFVRIVMLADPSLSQ